MTSGSEVLRTKSRYCDLSSIRPNPVLGPPDLCFASAVDRKDRGGEASAATGDVAFFGAFRAGLEIRRAASSQKDGASYSFVCSYFAIQTAGDVPY
jgi:hypothetical protein